MSETTTINWSLLEMIVEQNPYRSTFSKEDMADIRSLERYGYIHLTQFRVQISAKGLNALTQHSTGGTHDELAARIKQLEAANDALRAAMNEAVRIFDRHGDEWYQAAWNMRAVLLTALDKGKVE